MPSSETTMFEVPASERNAANAHASARLTPPFHAASASIRRLDASACDARAALDVHASAEHSGPLADARRAP
jgi:hypothetical protein